MCLLSVCCVFVEYLLCVCCVFVEGLLSVCVAYIHLINVFEEVVWWLYGFL